MVRVEGGPTIRSALRLYLRYFSSTLVACTLPSARRRPVTVTLLPDFSTEQLGTNVVALSAAIA